MPESPRPAPDRDAKQTATFKIITGALKAYREKNADGTDGKRKLKGVGSSTCIDLYGDRMDKAALDQMVAQAKGMTIWLNHDYELPGSVFGTCVDASIVQREDAGQTYYDLELEIEVQEESEAAVKTWTYVYKGTKLGISIGCLVEEWDYVPAPKGSDDDGYFAILSVYVLEFSIVGIPANQRSWVQEARKSLVAGADWKAKVADARAKRAIAPTITVKEITTDPETTNPADGDATVTPFADLVERFLTLLDGETSTPDPIIEDTLKQLDADHQQALARAHGRLAKALGVESAPATPAPASEPARERESTPAATPDLKGIEATLAGLTEQLAAVQQVVKDAAEAARSTEQRAAEAKAVAEATEQKVKALQTRSAGRPTLYASTLPASRTPLTSEQVAKMAPEEVVAYFRQPADTDAE